MAVSSGSDVPPQRPRVLLLSIDSKPWFDEMYSHLVDKLFEHATIQRASNSDAAVRYLSANHPDAILATDPGLTDPSNSRALDSVLTYVRSGGVLIFCCLFSSFINAPTFNRFMRTKLNFPWAFGNYHRTTVYLNQRAVLSSATNRHLAKERLPQSYSQKAVHLKNVDNAVALYLPGRDSVVESHVFPPGPVNREQTPVAFQNLGQGCVGYIGDVNGEEGSDQVILAMCGV
ncbi:hypothetical protein DTO166G4_1516 [Paecilomyces variotii]|nr:hypothetical protein DTO166G4_1516 [Paecilomyces variotii]KAJ9226124.1 hypothetical protein DTO169C6_1337 [Paecilomyces variotii]KAJ9242604.1 hypothetical protein DTO166G5_359 [Paecilomyces variotii]KAJ9266596.1 hypothetical protein DTO195F2_1119 [Paecilomyces variotii]KAJ9329168.1 hypothetical protein DTO027B3_568 [Paecilomyces variotii]